MAGSVTADARLGQRRGHLAMLAFSALVAGSFSLGTMIANDIAPTSLTTARFVLTGAVVGLLALAQRGVARSRRGGVQHAGGRVGQIWRYPVLGGLFAAYFVLMFEGLKTAPAVSAAAVFTLTPVMSAGFGWILLRQVTTARMAAALAIGAAGAVWVIFRADLGALAAFRVGQGELIYLGGCAFHAAYTPMLRKLHRGESGPVYTVRIVAAASLLLLVWGWHDIMATGWTALSPFVWMVIVYLAVMASSVTFLLLQYAARQLPSAKVMAYTYLTPSWVICWEIALGHGVPPGLILVGVGMTVVALVMLLENEPAA